MGLLRRFIRNDLAELHRNGVRVRVIGDREDLAPDIRSLLEEAEELTRDNDLTLVVAFNYGARQEIARAARRLAQRCGGWHAEAEVTADRLANTSMRPICRIPISSSAPAASSGCRTSCSGRRPIASWFSSPVYWPEFDRAALEQAIVEYPPPRTAVRRARRQDRIVARDRSRTGGRPGAKQSQLRVISSLVLAPLALIATYLGGVAFALFWLAVSAVVCGNGHGWSLARGSRTVALIDWLAGGFAYAAGCCFRHDPAAPTPQFGLSAIMFLFAIVWATDIVAYFVGRMFGGPKLCRGQPQEDLVGRGRRNARRRRGRPRDGQAEGSYPRSHVDRRRLRSFGRCRRPATCSSSR